MSLKTSVAVVVFQLFVTYLHAAEFSGVWVNDGADKVTKDELRATIGGVDSVKNTVWDGATVHLLASRNEVVQFNLILETVQNLENIKISLQELKSDSGVLRSSKAVGDSIFHWDERSIEGFLIQYLPIRGLSRLSYETYDERHIPEKLRRKSLVGGWIDRPNHDKLYPEIAVPLEVFPSGFSMSAKQNQSVWFDVYVPKETFPGIYKGTVDIFIKSKRVAVVPIELEVKPLVLPDENISKTMLFISSSDIANRYVGVNHPAFNSAQNTQVKLIEDRHFQMARRHRVSLINANDRMGMGLDQPGADWTARLNGDLYTKAHHYAGPLVGRPHDIFVIGAYGSWSWKNEGEAGMHQHANRWVDWFAKNAPQTEYFLYLIDESNNTNLIEKWSRWVKSNTGIGKALPIFATIPLPLALEKTPALDIAASWFTVGDTDKWTSALEQWRSSSGRKKFYLYNGKRPANGSFAIEDDGVALRELAWAQYKMNIDRWFYWNGTYYNNYQGGVGETDVFTNAQTFGAKPSKDPVLGETSWNYSNGDGVLFYPGTDKVFPKHSFGLNGPIASLRLKHWRRGIQDANYLALAEAKDPEAVKHIIERMVPKALWEYGVGKKSDPTWVRSNISWSSNPDDWEEARRELIAIIEGKTPKNLAERAQTRLKEFEKSNEGSFLQLLKNKIKLHFL